MLKTCNGYSVNEIRQEIRQIVNYLYSTDNKSNFAMLYWQHADLESRKKILKELFPEQKLRIKLMRDEKKAEFLPNRLSFGSLSVYLIAKLTTSLTSVNLLQFMACIGLAFFMLWAFKLVIPSWFVLDGLLPDHLAYRKNYSDDYKKVTITIKSYYVLDNKEQIITFDLL